MATWDKDRICGAIAERRVIEFRYKMELRRVEPHLVGYDSNGDLTLSAYQTSGLKPGWRDFHLTKLSELTVTEARFEHARSGYNPRDETIARVVCRI
jgi:predicted DNA-binding transcriptional regulator YafY